MEKLTKALMTDETGQAIVTKLTALSGQMHELAMATRGSAILFESESDISVLGDGGYLAVYVGSTNPLVISGWTGDNSLVTGHLYYLIKSGTSVASSDLGEYGGTAVTDTTLKLPGVPADAKAVGDALAGKADADDVDALETTVAGKADSADVTSLDTRVTAVEGESQNVQDFKVSTFRNPITFNRLVTNSYWTFGQEIVEATGANAVNDKACRTAYVSFDEAVLISLDNTDYEYVVWIYSGESISNALYSPNKAYKNEPLLIVPKASTSYFRIGVKRVDGAVLTTDYSDTSSDAYKILDSLRTYTQTSQTLDVDNVPIGAKAVKDYALTFKGYLASTDVNTMLTQGIYVLISDNTYTNAPARTGFLCVYKVGNVYAQMFYTLGEADTFLPVLYNRFAVGASVTSITSKWRMVGKYRKQQVKMACFGDSIMYGQNGNTSSQVEEQYRIPSMLAYNLNIETTNYGVGSQGYIGLISENAYDNIASKDLTQFNAMLICYGVNDGYSDLGTWDSTDETTIMGQFNKIVTYVFSQNPSIRLIVVAPYNGRNVGTFPKYWYGDRTHPDGYVSRQVLSDTLKQACEYYNIPYIEQKNSPINGYTIQTLIGTDGVHPSLEGYFQLGAWLSGEVGRLIG